MNSAKTIDSLVAGWKAAGASKSEIIVRAAEAEIGWCYVWGATGQQCTPDNRRTYANRSTCPASEAELTLKRCQVTRPDNPKSGCGGCKWYPDGDRTLMDDCQGFVKQVCKRIGISFTGGGCTSMWNADSNWSEKGEIATLPEKVCCVFWRNQKDKKTMEHIGFYIGGGMMIHCSGEVKKESLSKKCTHWAVPKGLDGDVPVSKPTLRKGSTGPYVVECQEDLISLGYDLAPYGADGKYGNKTVAAVKQFQKDHGLVADGVCGPKTWEALDAAVGPQPTPTTLYTVTIQHLTIEQAEELKKQYPDADVRAEGSELQ